MVFLREERIIPTAPRQHLVALLVGESCAFLLALGASSTLPSLVPWVTARMVLHESRALHKGCMWQLVSRYTTLWFLATCAHKWDKGRSAGLRLEGAQALPPDLCRTPTAVQQHG